MHVLPPVIVPGGGRFKSCSSVHVSVSSQSALEINDVIRWRFSMSQSGRHNAENGPTIEGRIPARKNVSFEECYQFMPGKIGFRRQLNCSGYNFEFGVPGTYRVFAWVERGGVAVSSTQSCVFELVATSAVASIITNEDPVSFGG